MNSSNGSNGIGRQGKINGKLYGRFQKKTVFLCSIPMNFYFVNFLEFHSFFVQVPTPIYFFIYQEILISIPVYEEIINHAKERLHIVTDLMTGV